jgi:hypothetical protein
MDGETYLGEFQWGDRGVFWNGYLSVFSYLSVCQFKDE